MISLETQRKVLELWALNLTTREIGQAVGLSKNSVCGMLKRLRDKGLDIPKRPNGFEAKTEKNKKIAKVAKVTKLKEKKPKAAPEPVAVVPIIIPVEPPKPLKKSGTFRFIDLRNNSCRYIVSGKRAEEFLFCGEPKTKGAYCKEHAALCYVPLSKHARSENRTFKLTNRNNGP